MGQDNTSQKQMKKRMSMRRGRRCIPNEKNSGGSVSVVAAVDKSCSCNNENENDVSSYAHPPRDVKPTMAENGGATPRQKQQRKRRYRKSKDKNKSGEQGGNGESCAIAVADKNRKVVPATKNISSKSDASDSNGPITIRISNPDFGKDLTLRVKKTTKMKKYFTSYASIKSIPSHVSLRFTIDGKDIQPDDTPEMLGLKENDVIKCSDSVVYSKKKTIQAEYSRGAYKNIYMSISGKLGVAVKNGKQCIITKKVDPNSQFNLYDIIISVNGHTYEQVIKMEGGMNIWMSLLRDPGVKNIGIIRPRNPPNLDFPIPHLRPDCGVHPFTSSNTNNADNAKCCPNCFCLVCDEYAYKCKEWDKNISNPTVGPHCHAHERDTKWINLAKARVKARRDAAANNTAAATNQSPAHNSNQRHHRHHHQQQQHASTTDTFDANALEKRDDMEAVTNVLLKNTDASSIVFEDECLMASILHFEGSWLTGTASDTIGLVCKSWNSFAIGKKGGKALAIILDEHDKKLIDVAKEVMKDESMSWSARILAMAIADDLSGLYKAFDDEYDSSHGIGAAFEEAKMYEGPVRSLEVVCPRDHPFYQCCNTAQQFHRDVLETYDENDPDDVDDWATLFAYNVAFAAAKVGSTSALSFIEEEIGGGNENMMWQVEFDDHGSSFIRRLVTYACRFPTLKGPVASVRELFPETCFDLYFYDHETANNLHLAASRGHNDLVRTLLKVGMDPNETCLTFSEPHLQKIRTPADFAEAKGHTELAQLLRLAQGGYGEEGYGTFLHCQVGGGSATGLTNTTFKVD